MFLKETSTWLTSGRAQGLLGTFSTKKLIQEILESHFTLLCAVNLVFNDSNCQSSLKIHPLQPILTGKVRFFFADETWF